MSKDVEGVAANIRRFADRFRSAGQVDFERQARRVAEAVLLADDIEIAETIRAILMRRWVEHANLPVAGAAADEYEPVSVPPWPIEPQTQTGEWGCWEASASMLGLPDVEMGDIDQGPYEGLVDTEKFAEFNELTMYYPETWSFNPEEQIEYLADLLQAGPVAAVGTWTEKDDAGNDVDYSHMFVIAGMSGDGTADGTVLTIYDPDPSPGEGVKQVTSYEDLLEDYDLPTYWILQNPQYKKQSGG